MTETHIGVGYEKHAYYSRSARISRLRQREILRSWRIYPFNQASIHRMLGGHGRYGEPFIIRQGDEGLRGKEIQEGYIIGDRRTNKAVRAYQEIQHNQEK